MLFHIVNIGYYVSLALETTLNEGIHFERRIFHTTFATVNHVNNILILLLVSRYFHLVTYITTGGQKGRYDCLCGEEESKLY